METLFKISLKSTFNNQILPQNLEQLKFIYKKIFNLNDEQLSKLKIYYMKQEKDQKIKENLENESDYMNFYSKYHSDLIEAELENETIGNIKSNDITPIPNLSNESYDNNCLRCLEKDCFLIPYIKLIKILMVIIQLIFIVEIIIKEQIFRLNIISLF